MLTINDLNLSIDFWKWLCGLTTTWIFAECDNEYGIMSIVRCIDIGIEYLSASQQELESIIYQAIDGYNNEYPETITQDYYCKGIYVKGYEQPFYYDEYENKTIARLAAFKWIWEQVNKNAL